MAAIARLAAIAAPFPLLDPLYRALDHRGCRYDQWCRSRKSGRVPSLTIATSNLNTLCVYENNVPGMALFARTIALCLFKLSYDSYILLRDKVL